MQKQLNLQARFPHRRRQIPLPYDFYLLANNKKDEEKEISRSSSSGESYRLERKEDDDDDHDEDEDDEALLFSSSEEDDNEDHLGNSTRNVGGLRHTHRGDDDNDDEEDDGSFQLSERPKAEIVAYYHSFQAYHPYYLYRHQHHHQQDLLQPIHPLDQYPSPSAAYYPPVLVEGDQSRQTDDDHPHPEEIFVIDYPFTHQPFLPPVVLDHDHDVSEFIVDHDE